MKPTTFFLQKVVNPETGEQLERIVTVFDSGKRLKLMCGDTSVAEMAEAISADKDNYLAKVVVRDTDFGQVSCISRAETIREL